jgi:hypothetical protein
MPVSRVDLRGLPVLRTERARQGDVERLADRPAFLVLGAARVDGVVAWRLGLLAWLLVQGTMVLRGGIVYVDGLEERDAAAYAALHDLPPVRSGLGGRPREVHDLTGFVRRILLPKGYRGQLPIVAGDLGRVLSLCSDWWRPCRGSARTQWFWRGGFAFGLHGAGHAVKRTRADGALREEWSGAPHSPMVRVKRLGVRGYSVAFARCPKYKGERAGKWVRDATGQLVPYGGRFVDVLADACTFDGLDTDDLAEHCAALGLPPVETPIAVAVDRAGVEATIACCEATWELALALDEVAARW